MDFMKIVDSNKESVMSEALAVLHSGGILVYPTETCYGVGVDATNSKAVTKVLDYKERPSGKAISIGVVSRAMASNYVYINSSAEKLYQNFLPGPVTIVSKSLNKIDRRLESENGTLGVRIPNYKFLLELIANFGKPITTTSANPSGKKTPYSIKDLLDNLSKKQQNLIDLIIDAGDLPHNPSSTVIDTTTEELTVYRKGRIDPTRVKTQLVKTSTNVDETIALGEEFIREHSIEMEESPMLILLNGELGAGKTHFTKGVANALKIKQVIKSPTYIYVNEYHYDLPEKNLRGKLYHFDAWRIQSFEDLSALGFKSWFQPGNVIVVEWPSVLMLLDEKFFERLNYYYIDFLIDSEQQRTLRLYAIQAE